MAKRLQKNYQHYRMSFLLQLSLFVFFLSFSVIVSNKGIVFEFRYTFAGYG